MRSLRGNKLTIQANCASSDEGATAGTAGKYLLGSRLFCCALFYRFLRMMESGFMPARRMRNTIMPRLYDRKRASLA